MFGLLAACMLAGTTAAQAQEPVIKTGFIAVNFGAQSTQHDIAISQSPIIYDEAASITTSQAIHNGPILEIGGGYRVLENVTVGGRYSMFSGRASDSTITAQIPDPVAYGRLRPIVQTTPDLAHSEHGIHIQATWFKAVTPKFDVAVSGGPSFIRVSQDFTNVTVPAGTQTIAVTKITQTGTAIGFNTGFDGMFMFNPSYGIGAFVRYTQGKVDLPSVPGLRVGGVQSGVGFRVRF